MSTGLDLYMDVHVPGAVTRELRKRGLDVMTSQEDGSAEFEDDELLMRATELERVLVSHDRDFLEISSRLQSQGIPFAGVVVVNVNRIGVGQYIDELKMFAPTTDPARAANAVQFLPLT